MITEILVATLSVLYLVWHLLNESRRPYKFPPGPSWLPYIGNLPELKKLSRALGGQHLAFIELSKKYNTEVVGLKLGKEYVICVCSLETIRKVLTFDEYVGRPNNFFLRLRSMGSRNGITGTDGALWREQRSFLVSHLKALGFGKSIMEEMVKDEVREVFLDIEKNPNSVNIASVLAPSVLNILWILTSGKSLRGNPRIDKLFQLLLIRTKAFDMSGGVLNTYPWLRFFAPEMTGYNLIRNINRGLKDFIMETVKEHRQTWEEGMEDDVIYSFLSEMKKKEGTPSFFTEEQLVMVCLDIFIAGSTTTSNTMNFAFLAMVLYPEIQEKVYQEISSAFSKEETISYSERHRLPYVEAVLLECQRMWPVVPIAGPRRVLKDTYLDKYIIPKETTVLINFQSVYNDKTHWKDPENFRPERFLDSDGKIMSDKILTFGLGKRRCLGEVLAKTCVFTFFVEIIRKYKITVASNTKRPTGKPIPGITLTPEEYTATFIPR